jgi:FhuF 2Fe-2S C-terminal domain
MREPAAEVDASGALAAAAGAGPYFAVEPWAAGAGWRPARLLADDQAVLAERVEHARGVLAGRAGLPPDGVAERVAASIVFLGLAARLVSPSLGAAVLGGVVPGLTLDSLWWRPVDGGPVPLAARAVTGRAIRRHTESPNAANPDTADLDAADLDTADLDAADLDEAAALLSERSVQGVAVPVAAAFRAQFRLSPLVLRGNIASALAGAAGMLAAQFPDRAEAAGQLTARMLARGPLAGAGRLVQPDPSRPRRFLVRNSCCLLYRVPGGGMCGDCVLTPEHVRRQQWQAALSR